MLWKKKIRKGGWIMGGRCYIFFKGIIRESLLDKMASE